ncbi:hypothetical protein [Aliarcobacter butzleri]|uniref:hypothetical protein n=1 Tax=Aliarcobacter butzleri TaxID=28197 RepID=UPI0021B34027|nr:hypothetical protein [Aliarcobacter butzleri]MCT7567027.1 hypothetical protein [Aliarcobacter butzleri]
MEIIKDSKNSEFYISNKKEREQLFFKVDYHINTFEDNKKEVNFSMEAIVSYFFLIKDNKYQDIVRKTNTFEIDSTVSYKSCSLKNSILIQSEFRSYGIGSFLLNQILSEAVKHVPDYSLSADLSIVDDREEENRLRRNALYENVGFNIIMDENSKTCINGKIQIDKLSNLKLNRKFEYIEKIDLFMYADIFYKLSEKNSHLEEKNIRLLRICKDYEVINYQMEKKLEKYFLFVLSLVIVSILTIYLKFIQD